MVLGNYLTVAKWQPNFPLPQDKILSTMVWLCFPEIPIEFFQDSLLMRIGNLVGLEIKIYPTTLSTS